jgi:hypothetical protein
VQLLPSGMTQLSTGAISGLPDATGTFHLTVFVTDSISTHVFGTVDVTVSGSNPVLPVTAWPPSQSISPTGNVTYNVAVNGTAGFSGPVNLTVSGLPSGASPVFNPTTVNSLGATTLTVSAGSGTQLGAFPLIVTAQNGTRSYNTSVMLTVASASAASMISPAPGAILTTSSAPFAWDSGMGASQYQLTLGSTPGGSNYFQMNTGTARSATAQLPTSGAVYATLGSKVNDTWQNQSYSYSIGQPPATVPLGLSSDQSPVVNPIPNDNMSHTGFFCLSSLYNGGPCDDGGLYFATRITDCVVEGSGNRCRDSPN